MRKCNAILTGLILALFLAHGVLGSFQMLGVSNGPLKALSWIMAALVAVHTCIGVKLTADTVKAQKKTGAAYFRENTLFWARRVSGLAVMAFLLLHVTAFGYHTPERAYRLKWFTAGKLTAQLLLAASVAVHIISNVRPMLISFGIRGLKQWAADILAVVSVLLLFMAAAFVVYYLRWNVL